MRPQKTPIFIGCEGMSEVGYAAWLRNLVRDHGLPFHLEISDLGQGAGDPLARIQLAVERITRIERNKETFAERFLMLDTDQLAFSPDRARQAHQRARENNLSIIWQNPTHEAFLLRHFPKQSTRMPPDSRAAEAALVKVWTNYRKPCDAHAIEQHLALDGAFRVAANVPEFGRLLALLGLPTS